MALSLNKVLVTGRLTRDPELQHTANGRAFVRFTIANNRAYKDKDGNWQEETSFFDVVAWGNSADSVVERFSKGDLVFVEGRLVQNSWTNKEGEKRSKVEINAARVSLVARKADSSSSNDVNDIDDIEF